MKSNFKIELNFDLKPTLFQKSSLPNAITTVFGCRQISLVFECLIRQTEEMDSTGTSVTPVDQHVGHVVQTRGKVTGRQSNRQKEINRRSDQSVELFIRQISVCLQKQ